VCIAAARALRHGLGKRKRAIQVSHRRSAAWAEKRFDPFRHFPPAGVGEAPWSGQNLVVRQSIIVLQFPEIFPEAGKLGRVLFRGSIYLFRALRFSLAQWDHSPV
jgi:hypothetical protein